MRGQPAAGGASRTSGLALQRVYLRLGEPRGAGDAVLLTFTSLRFPLVPEVLRLPRFHGGSGVTGPWLPPQGLPSLWRGLAFTYGHLALFSRTEGE